MTMVIHGTNGATFPDSSVQASAGKVLQVVQASYSTTVTSSTNTPVATGLSASITPKFSTSKILVLVNHSENIKNNFDAGNSIGFWLYKNGSNLIQFAKNLGYTGTAIQNNVPANFIYLDSPATTSSTTYSTYFSSQNSNAAAVQAQAYSMPSTITLMEIAA